MRGATAARPMRRDRLARGDQGRVVEGGRRRDECAKDRSAVQARRRVEQRAATCKVHALAPDQCIVAHDLDALAPASAGEALAARGSPEADELPRDEAGRRRDREVEGRLRAGTVEDDRALREPFEDRPVGHARVHVLRGRGPGAAIPLRRGGLRELRMRPGPDVEYDLQRVATRDAAGRVDDDDLAHRVALRVERLLHDQRAFVRAPRKTRATLRVLEAERKRRAPGRCSFALRERRRGHARQCSR